MKFINKIILIIIFNTVLTSPVLADTSIKKAVVKIYTVNNRYNYHEPWQMQGQSTFQGSGVVIQGERILTNAHVVSDQTFIQIRRAGKAKKFTASIEIIAHESDLAILRVKDKSFLRG